MNPIDVECDTLRDLLHAKSENYGNSYAHTPRLAHDIDPDKALLVRMSDKIERLVALANGEQDKVGESFDDTLLDLAGYIILYRVITRQIWRQGE